MIEVLKDKRILDIKIVRKWMALQAHIVEKEKGAIQWRM